MVNPSWTEGRFIPVGEYLVVRLREQPSGVLGLALFKAEGNELILHRGDLQELISILAIKVKSE